MQYLLRFLVILMPLLCFVSANPIAQAVGDLNIDALPRDSTDNTLIASIDDSSGAEMSECQPESSNGLSDGNIDFDPDENTMRRRDGAVCRPTDQKSTPSTPELEILSAHLKPVIKTPSKPNDRCPEDIPMFLSCGGPEVLETDPVSDKRIKFYVVINCVEGFATRIEARFPHDATDETGQYCCEHLNPNVSFIFRSFCTVNIQTELFWGSRLLYSKIGRAHV